MASINLSTAETWPYRLKTQPRPTGKSTQAIVTTYDLPEGAAPHDTLLDKAGNVWYSDFQNHYISKLDPKTGKVTRYPVPISKPGFPTGGLMITMDKDGNVWEAAVDSAAELVEMVETARQYQNNVQVLETAKGLINETLRMGQ